MKMRVYGVACFFSLFIAQTLADDARYASILLDPVSNELFIKSDVSRDAVAWGRFSNQVNKTGWSYLEVHTEKSYPDEIQSRAAGMVEGYLTADFILMHWKNTLANYCSDNKEMCEKLNKFLYKNSIFLSTNIEAKYVDPYWYQIKLLYQQLLGLRQGYIASETGMSNPLTAFDFNLMQLEGLSDLEMALINRTTRHHAVGQGSCSALIKLLPNNKDLFISHVTWDTYTTMLRIYKLYELQLVNNSNPAYHIVAQNHSFSSFPGMLFSGDDFYVLSSGLVTQETTIENFNDDLWQYIQPNSVLEWARTVVANRIAQNGRRWVSLYSKYNSGTYNNQWMVLDYNMFTPGKPVVPGTLWILEQMPGMVQMADVSIVLKKNDYWASYNIPFFEAISTICDQEIMIKKYGPWFDYNLSPRAQIFKRDQGKVVDLETMLKLMRYNDYTHDPLSKCNCTPPYSAVNAISSRCDLNPASGKYPFGALGHGEYGATDAKITNYEMFQNFAVYAVSGPTHDQQPVFNWTMSGWDRPLGHPDVWDFKPVMISWNRTQTNLVDILDIEE